mgnify:CR=1 FL=1
METWHVVLLALVQALTEFLPVSSSGHLALVGFFLGWPYQGITFDLALHLGTLVAVIAYFWRDLLAIARETLKLRRWRDATPLQREGVGLVGHHQGIQQPIVGGVQLGVGETAFDAMRAAGVSVLGSCLEGICGTCEQIVIEGDVDHRDSVLDEDEREANECMMVCVSRAKTPVIVLDA